MEIVVMAAIGATAIWYLTRHRDPRLRARFLKRLGFGLIVVMTAFFGVFVVGDTISDPGGLEAAGLIGLWAVPLVVLALLAWFRPDWAVRVLCVASVAVVGSSAWYAADPGGWRQFEDVHGPVRAIVSFVCIAALAILGLRRTAVAGWLLLLVTASPLIAFVGAGHGVAAWAVFLVGSPGLLAGLLFVASSRLSPRPRPKDGAGSAPVPKPA